MLNPVGRWAGLLGAGLAVLLLLQCQHLAWLPTPAPPHTERPLLIATPTPTGLQVAVERAWRYPGALPWPAPQGSLPPISTTVGTPVTPLGVFLVLEMRVSNVGAGPLALSLAEIYVTDTDGRWYARARDAEFGLTLHGYTLLPERALPPGASARGVVVVDAPADVSGPLQVGVGLPGQPQLLSAPFTVE